MLDGHFCLFNKDGIPKSIDENTYTLINPMAISVVTHDVYTIHERLEIRDGNKYSIKVLTEMQALEVAQAVKVSKLLSVPYFEVQQENLVELKNFIIENK